MDRKVRKRLFQPRRLFGLGLVLVLATFTGYSLLKDSGVHKLNVQRDRLTISTVDLGPFLEYTPVRGSVLPIRTIYLDGLVRGQVAQVFVEEGALVAPGDPLLRLTNPELELQVFAQEAEYEKRQEALTNGRLTMEQNLLRSRQVLLDGEYKLAVDKRNFDRYQALSKQDLEAMVARQDYEQVRDAYEYSARRIELVRELHAQDSLLSVNKVAHLADGVERTKRNLEVFQRRLENLTVRAPVGGQLTALDVEIGASKSAGQRLGQIDIVDNFKVRATIDEHYINRVHQGLRGEFDLGDQTYGLVIRKVYPEVKQVGFEVDLVFESVAPAGIRRGQTLHIRLELGDLSEAVQVARGGFYQTTGGHWVYVLAPSGKEATRRNIKLGRQNPRVYEVLEGLKPGEKVISSSYENFGENIDMLVLH